MTEYDIQRTARAVVDLLLTDDRFIRRIDKVMPKRSSRMLNSRQAGERLGISPDTLRDVAPFIGGIKKGDDRRGRWTFEE